MPKVYQNSLELDIQELIAWKTGAPFIMVEQRVTENDNSTSKSEDLSSKSSHAKFSWRVCKGITASCTWGFNTLSCFFFRDFSSKLSSFELMVNHKLDIFPVFWITDHFSHLVQSAKCGDHWLQEMSLCPSDTSRCFTCRNAGQPFGINGVPGGWRGDPFQWVVLIVKFYMRLCDDICV